MAKKKTRPSRRVEVFKGQTGWFFHVVAANGEIVMASESYTRRSSAIRAAEREHPSLKVIVDDRANA